MATPVAGKHPMKIDAFSGFHPVVNFLYFVAVIGLAMFLMHPVCLGISLGCAAAYSVYLGGKRAVRMGIKYMLPMLVFTALLNPVFNHRGVTILAYLPNGNPLTFESILFGIAAAVMLITVTMWFACWGAVMTSDKFIYLFGRVIPALSLILSMSLRLVPRFGVQLKVISNAQRCIGREIAGGSILQKIQRGAKILSIMTTWALENAIETAQSMKSRGYGIPGRTAFSIFRFKRRDTYAIAYILACSGAVVTGAISGALHFRYFPSVAGNWRGVGTIVLFAAYLALGALPILVNLREDLAWKRIESRT